VITMLDLLGWNVGMSGVAAIVLLTASILIGAIPQFIGEPRLAYEWVVTAIGVLVGGWLGSEAFGAASTWGPVWDGLYIVPALIGGLVVGAIVDAAVRYLSGGSYTHHAPTPI
jgi:uncharacterized membrane protein YeaQ/YmgE (transglycosylase-associated protein family)